MRGLLVALRGLVAFAIIMFSFLTTQVFLKPELSRQYGDASVVVRFDSPLSAECFNIIWETENATDALLDTQTVPVSGSRYVCPSRPSEPRLAVTFDGQGMRFFGREPLWNNVATRLVFLLTAAAIFVLTFYLPRLISALLAGGLLAATGAWAVIGMPLLPVVSLLEFVFNVGLMPQVFIVALIVPVLYWLIPARWRNNLLLVVSFLMLLRGGVSIEYAALLIMLISLTWTVIALPSNASTRPVSTLQLRIGLAAIIGLALVVALHSRMPSTMISATLSGIAVTGGLIVIAAMLTMDSEFRKQHVSWLLPVTLMAGSNLWFVMYPEANMTSPWSLLMVCGVMALMCACLCLIWGKHISDVQQRQISGTGVFLLILIFVLFKLPTDGISLAWFGFSYIAFRLLHVLLDKRLKMDLPAAGLCEWSLYTLFFSAQAVGPIDRWNRFAGDIAAAEKPSWEAFVSGWERILWGTIKKFFIADILLRDLIPGGIPIDLITPAYAWLQLYAYALYLYCDFSGFVDIAIGTARLIGFHLPENFNRPYTRGSLAQFWQSWHITLSGWLRAYVFLPLMRSLLRTRLKHNVLLIVLLVNLVTMSLIGLWHGFTPNYLAWGIWHAVGLFVHKVFSDATRRRQMTWKNTWCAPAFHIVSVLLTFHFVTTGWVFFALPTLEQSARYLALLAGMR